MRCAARALPIKDPAAHVASVTTFNGVLDVMDHCKPSFAMLENVENIDRVDDDMCSSCIKQFEGQVSNELSGVLYIMKS